MVRYTHWGGPEGYSVEGGHHWPEMPEEGKRLWAQAARLMAEMESEVEFSYRPALCERYRVFLWTLRKIRQGGYRIVHH